MATPWERSIRACRGRCARCYSIMTETAVPVGAGVAMGVASAFALTRLAEKMLYGVSPTDPVTFAGAGGLLILSAVLAAPVPSRNAPVRLMFSTVGERRGANRGRAIPRARQTGFVTQRGWKGSFPVSSGSLAGQPFFTLGDFIDALGIERNMPLDLRNSGKRILI
jgi:hypothetical protein